MSFGSKRLDVNKILNKTKVSNYSGFLSNSSINYQTSILDEDEFNNDGIDDDDEIVEVKRVKVKKRKKDNKENDDNKKDIIVSPIKKSPVKKDPIKRVTKKKEEPKAFEEPKEVKKVSKKKVKPAKVIKELKPKPAKSAKSAKPPKATKPTKPSKSVKESISLFEVLDDEANSQDDEIFELGSPKKKPNKPKQVNKKVNKPEIPKLNETPTPSRKITKRTRQTKQKKKEELPIEDDTIEQDEPVSKRIKPSKSLKKSKPEDIQDFFVMDDIPNDIPDNVPNDIITEDIPNSQSQPDIKPPKNSKPSKSLRELTKQITTEPLKDTTETTKIPLRDETTTGRASMLLRGKRLSSIGNGFTAIPHEEIPINKLYEHVDQSLPESYKLRQLIIWISKRLLKDNEQMNEIINKEKFNGKKEEYKEIINEMINSLSKGSIDVDWWGEEVGEYKRENIQNIRNASKLEYYKNQIERLKKEEEELKKLEIEKVVKNDNNSNNSNNDNNDNKPIIKPIIPDWEDDIERVEKIYNRVGKLERLLHRFGKSKEVINRVMEYKEGIIAQVIRDSCDYDVIEILKSLV